MALYPPNCIILAQKTLSYESDKEDPNLSLVNNFSNHFAGNNYWPN